MCWMLTAVDVWWHIQQKFTLVTLLTFHTGKTWWGLDSGSHGPEKWLGPDLWTGRHAYDHGVYIKGKVTSTTKNTHRYSATESLTTDENLSETTSKRRLVSFWHLPCRRIAKSAIVWQLFTLAIYTAEQQKRLVSDNDSSTSQAKTWSGLFPKWNLFPTKCRYRNM